MSLYNRRTFILTVLAALPACGFSPVYGPDGAGTALQGAVLVDAPVTRDEFLLTQDLETRLGQANPGKYGLSYLLVVVEEPIAISKNNVTTRYRLLGDIDYALRDLDTQEVVNSGRVSNFTSYSASGSTVAQQAAERDARRRLMTILADQIVTRLLATAPASGI